MDEERDPMTDPKNNPAIPGSPLIKRDDLDMTDPKNNPHIPRDFEEEKPPDNPLVPGFEKRQTKRGDTIPELLERLNVCKLRFGNGFYLQRLGDCTQIFKNREVVELDDLEADELKDLRSALLEIDQAKS